jgi:phosphoglycerol transferase
VLVVLWAFRGKPGLGSLSRAGQTAIPWRQWLGAAGLCILAASSGIYYAFFFGFFLAVAGVAACIRARNAWHLANAVGLAAIVLIAVGANLSPTLVYQARAGRNPIVASRGISSEIYGLKIVQLLLPRDGHRRLGFANWKDAYNLNAPMVNENRTASLGAVGSAGFLFLIGYLVLGRRRESVLDDLAALNVCAVLLGTLGGFGALLMFVAIPQIRAYNRISVFIGFFSLVALALLFDSAKRSLKGKHVWAALLTAAGVCVIILGVFDQTAPAPVSEATRAAVAQDRAFCAHIEAALPVNAMVFQLPYVAFPESPSVVRMLDYDHFRMYLSSGRLRWSYGAMKGREGDRWQREVTSQAVPQMLKSLSEAGFDGVYINRNGYADNAARLEGAIQSVLHAPPLVSADDTMAFYSMPLARGEPGVRAGLPRMPVAGHAVSLPVTLKPSDPAMAAGGFVPGDPLATWFWSMGQFRGPVLTIPQDRDVQVLLRLHGSTPDYHPQLKVTTKGDRTLFDRKLDGLAIRTSRIVGPINVPASVHRGNLDLIWRLDTWVPAKNGTNPNDPRQLGLDVETIEVR